ncbi:MAG: DUF1800 family protein [Pseudomonadota bacterium]
MRLVIVTFAFVLGHSAAAVGLSDPRSQTPYSCSGSRPVPSAFETTASTSRFLTQATFGPTKAAVGDLTGGSASRWFVQQLQEPASLNVPQVEGYMAMLEDPTQDFQTLTIQATTLSFWRNAIEADDQLRQRMAFALSQILVVSNFRGEVLTDIPEGVAYFQDILTEQAFGNYRDLLETVTYSPAMGDYLTYMGNQKADPETGRMPDENYARELLQLFTIGPVALQPDGQPLLDANNRPIEIYDNTDITGLARVFTGLDLKGLNRDQFPALDNIISLGTGLEKSFLQPMAITEALHSTAPKQFLSCAIPARTKAAPSIAKALDCIIEQPNVGPFVSRQLIQRLTTSAPEPGYVLRVSKAFNAGRFVLPDGTKVGEGRKGDLAATVAAILFDPEARCATALADRKFGKIREPVLRFTHWARAFDVDASHPQYAPDLYDLIQPDSLAQHPYRSKSVFNFYRPGYIAPGTRSGALGLTVPELQIVDATTTPAYINFIALWAYGGPLMFGDERYEELALAGVPVDTDTLEESFIPNYSQELDLAGNVEALVDHLDALLLYGSMSDATKSSIGATLIEATEFEPEEPQTAYERVALAVLLVMTSPDYLVQR